MKGNLHPVLIQYQGPWCQLIQELRNMVSYWDQNMTLSHREQRLAPPRYCIYPKYWDRQAFANSVDPDILSTYHTCPKIWNSPFCYLLMCLKYCCMYSKQRRHWSDTAFCGTWSESTLLANAYLSQYLGLLCYSSFEGPHNFWTWIIKFPIFTILTFTDILIILAIIILPRK